MVAKEYVDQMLAAASASALLHAIMQCNLFRQGFGESGAAYDER
jgi:hypothetical protein